jgi:hypothetical protein
MKWLLFVSALFMLAGCTYNTANLETTRVNTVLNLDKSQYEITGDITGQATGTWVLFFRVNRTTMCAGSFNGWQYSDMLSSEAVYDAIQKSNGADAMIAPRYTTTFSGVPPFYMHREVNVIGKGIRLK